MLGRITIGDPLANGGVSNGPTVSRCFPCRQLRLLPGDYICVCPTKVFCFLFKGNKILKWSGKKNISVYLLVPSLIYFVPVCGLKMFFFWGGGDMDIYHDSV